MCRPIDEPVQTCPLHVTSCLTTITKHVPGAAVFFSAEMDTWSMLRIH